MLAHCPLATSKTINAGDTVRVGINQLSIEVLNGGFSTFIANKMIDHTFKGISYPMTSSIFIALTTGSITGSMTGTNIPSVTGSNYSRLSHDLWATASTAGTHNYGTATFATASSTDWGTVVSAALCDSGSTGNVLVYGALSSSVAVTTDDELSFATASLLIILD